MNRGVNHVVAGSCTSLSARKQNVCGSGKVSYRSLDGPYLPLFSNLPATAPAEERQSATRVCVNFEQDSIVHDCINVAARYCNTVLQVGPDIDGTRFVESGDGSDHLKGRIEMGRHAWRFVLAGDSNQHLRNPLDPKEGIHYLSYQLAPLALASSESVSDCSKWDFAVSDTLVGSRKS